MMTLTQRELERRLRDAAPAVDASEASEALMARAEREGLVDVAYATMDSPFGELLVASTDRGIVRVGLPNRPSDQVLTELATLVSPRVLESPRRLDQVRRELDDYFEGKLDRFGVPVDWRLSRGFTGKVLHEVGRIPY